MTAGLMQLIAYGAQDVYLTGNPQITFFKVVYRRYTNFAIETIEHSFIGNPTFDKRSTVRITRNGDLVTRMYLQVTLNRVDPEGTNFAWVRRIGHAIIREVEVEIGGTKVDRQYGTWLDIWYELARHGDHERGYDRMIGDINLLTGYNDEIKPEYTLYIPLQFWFNKFVGLAIPLIALQYHDVNINVDFEERDLLAVRDCNFDMNNLIIKNASILVDYVYLDTEERRRFAQVAHEYLIEQVQWNGIELVNDIASRYRLDFNHPVKEIFWAMKNGNYITGKNFVYYTNGDWIIEDAACLIIEKSISIGNDPTDIVGGTWIEVLSNEISTIGTFNITNKSTESIYINPESLKVGEYGITDKINADITIQIDDTISCQNVVTSLTIRDLSISVENMEDTRFNVCDPIVYQFNNYGIMIDGTINPVESGLLHLNGHERFDRREGAWYNYVQPEMHHSNTPADGINVYSFSIYPEEHQPSGTANLSRIESTDLFLRFVDPTDENDNPSINLINEDNRLFIYGTNYNILRIMSGLSGLAYTVG